MIMCVTMICATGIAVAAVNLQNNPSRASASVNEITQEATEPPPTVAEAADSSLLRQVSTTEDAVEDYKLRRAEYEEYLASLRTYASSDITEDEIVEMLSYSDETQIISADELDIGSEDTQAEEHNSVEVVDETGVELFENASLSYGIDVSHYQNEIDWAQVAQSGIDFALIKCGGRSVGSDANLYQDSYFDANVQGALANGIQVGIYFFSQATNVKEAYEEASYCVNLIDRYQITYPVAIDWESSNGYRVNDVNLSADELTQIVEVFCDTIEGCGYQPMVYFCRNDWYKRVNAQELTSKYKTWLAVYYNEYYYTSETWQLGKSVAEFDYTYDCWQYGVSDSVPGIDGYVDMNLAFFSYSDYEVKGLQEPELNVNLKELSVTQGESWNLLTGVFGVNSLGYLTDVSCKIGGTEYTDTSSLAAGKYTVTYSFKDPRRGLLSETTELTVYTAARIEVKNPSPVIYAGDTFNVLNGVTAYDSSGSKVTPATLITNTDTGIHVTNVTAAGNYRIDYNFTDSRQGIVSKSVILKVKAR